MMMNAGAGAAGSSRMSMTVRRSSSRTSAGMDHADEV